MERTILAFYRGRKKVNPEASWFDRIICFFTNSEYSHVELVNCLNEKTNYGECWSSSPRDGGVRSTVIDFSTGHWDLFEITTEHDHESIDYFFNKHNGKKYDWIGAIGAYRYLDVVLRQNPKRWFCTEIIGACLGYKNSALMTPEDMYQHIKFFVEREISHIELSQTKR